MCKQHWITLKYANGELWGICLSTVWHVSTCKYQKLPCDVRKPWGHFYLLSQLQLVYFLSQLQTQGPGNHKNQCCFRIPTNISLWKMLLGPIWTKTHNKAIFFFFLLPPFTGVSKLHKQWYPIRRDILYQHFWDINTAKLILLKRLTLSSLANLRFLWWTVFCILLL